MQLTPRDPEVSTEVSKESPQSLLATVDLPSTVAWDFEASPDPKHCPSIDRWDLTVTPHFDPSAHSQLRLEIVAAPAPPLGTPKEAWYIPEHRLVRTTVAVNDQQSVILGFGRRVHGMNATLVIKPYLIWSEADLRRLFQCKVARARAAAPAAAPAPAAALPSTESPPR